MRFASEDIQQDTPRPLARCGTYVAPGQDARWRGCSQVVRTSKKVLTQQVDSIFARKLGRATR